MTHLHFTFGPVQPFVAQARRTRDLYAGSFLLSHLAMTAMGAGGRKVILPDYDNLKRLATNSDFKHALAPNRFIAEFADEETAARAGREAAEALQTKWKNIADRVWINFLAEAAGQGPATREIWDRQIQNFWEIAWAVGEENSTDLLDRRKNWRTPPVTTEGGDHCTLMGQWQELSGFIRSRQRDDQERFWKGVREHVRAKGGTKLDLEDDERLCAIAFVKRFLANVSEQAIDRKLDMQHWPSTVSIAALPWLRKIAQESKPDLLAKARAYTELVADEPGAKVSSARRFAALNRFPPDAGDFPRLSGNFLNRTALKNERGTPLKDDSKERRDLLLARLRDLEDATGDRAGNFYALLLMDGDSMGKLIQEHGAKPMADCLTRFASDAPALVENEQNSGICVYAGGDDLLAMLPLDHALEAVAATRKLYVQSFPESEKPIKATISAGLVFAHYRCAFSRVLEYARELLDGVAKDGAGRDALALGVLKPGGVACQWVGKFEQFLQDGTDCFAPLITAYCREASNEGRGLSSGFLYNLRERFGELFEPTRSQAHQDAAGSDAEAAEPFDRETLQRLFVAEFLHGRLDKDPAKAKQQRQTAEELMRQLIAVCHQPDARRPVQCRFNLDGARLVKFLALDGKEGVQ